MTLRKVEDAVFLMAEKLGCKEEVEVIFDGECPLYPFSDVSELELEVRTLNCLKNTGINMIYQLCRATEEDVARTRNLGKKSLNELKDKLRENGLYFGMTEEGLYRWTVDMLEDRRRRR